MRRRISQIESRLPPRYLGGYSGPPPYLGGYQSRLGTMLTSNGHWLHSTAFEMHPQIQESKLALRRQMRERLAKMPEPQRVAASRAARELLSAQSVWKQAQSILFFAPLAAEPDLWPLVAEALAAGKTAALPRFDPAEKKYVAARIADAVHDIRSGQFGIREPHDGCAPIPLNQLDLVLVPGTAFDLSGRRLGRGKGFYDQLLTLVRGKTCGIAFDEQIVTEVPVEPHDVRLNFLLTPTRWVVI